jgi:hypothetical protein
MVRQGASSWSPKKHELVVSPCKGLSWIVFHTRILIFELLYPLRLVHFRATVVRLHA